MLLASLLLAAFLATRIAKTVLTEWRLRQEERSLLAANAPQQLLNTLTVTFTADGHLLLPDGREAWLDEMKLPSPAAKEMSKVVADVVARFRAEKLGYTIVGADEDGAPLVQIWALSPRAYQGMCGNSTVIEHRQGGMRLWRNVGALLVEQNQISPSAAGERSHVSVIGW